MVSACRKFSSSRNISRWNWKIVIVIFAGTNSYADGVPLEKMAQWQADLIRYMSTSYPEVGRDILAKKTITDDNRAAMTKALDGFRAGWIA